MKVFILSILFSCGLYSQVLDPLKFFPSSVGDTWEYQYPTTVLREEIYKDSVDDFGNRYLFYKAGDNTYITPKYRIDRANNMIYWKIFNREWAFYKLDSDSGDSWIVEAYDFDNEILYKMALCKNQYAGYFYDYPTVFMEITYYHYQPDTIINSFSWPVNTVTLAYGIGEILDFDEEGGGPQKLLLGCIVEGDTTGIISSVKDHNQLNSFELYQNYPNPFNPTTTIRFSISEPQQIKLTVYSLLGEEIKVLIDEYRTAGNHSILFNSEGLSSGVYIYTLRTDNKTKSKKFILLK